jgi:hypothetical protein
MLRKDNKKAPININTTENTKALTGEICPDGIGLDEVRNINLSVFLSRYWFRAEEPAANKNTPTKQIPNSKSQIPDKFKIPKSKLCGWFIERKNPIQAEKAIAEERIYFVKRKYCFMF